MRYYRQNGKEYVKNGRSLLQVSTMRQARSPYHANRVLKIMVVQKVLSQSPTNKIEPGEMINLSFPEARVNARKYDWKPGEPTQSAFNIKLHESDWVEGDPEPAPPSNN